MDSNQSGPRLKLTVEPRLLLGSSCGEPAGTVLLDSDDSCSNSSQVHSDVPDELEHQISIDIQGRGQQSLLRLTNARLQSSIAEDSLEDAESANSADLEFGPASGTMAKIFNGVSTVSERMSHLQRRAD